ncbi:hypothetical protein B0T22DRAFT_270095 [Podospora appendiculata]|uniref:SnoaL-like domain-containing protein n=1 Tax=Podospora appendiculata TaxID=314037 RepID=A0AAE0X3N0_9PEZI|nr:hypothetical protein B0T22DRAFT_270095 [Podospora appendiculata]
MTVTTNTNTNTNTAPAEPDSHDSSTTAPPPFTDTTALLRFLYQDLSRISQVAADDILLHRADRDLSSPPLPPVRGKRAVQAHEDALIAATGGTLVMEVHHVQADEHFGTVLGTARATARGQADLAMPFCGVWRFVEGRAVEHWENAMDAAAMARWLALAGSCDSGC